MVGLSDVLMPVHLDHVPSLFVDHESPPKVRRIILETGHGFRISKGVDKLLLGPVVGEQLEGQVVLSESIVHVEPNGPDLLHIDFPVTKNFCLTVKQVLVIPGRTAS